MSRFSMLDAMDALEDAQSEAAERYADADNKHNSPEFLAKANSHTILIIDTSASMRYVDAATGEIDGKTGEIKCMSRIAALQKAVAHGFVKQQLVSGVSENDLVSVLRLQDDSQFICELESMPAMLERGLLPSTIMPKSHGNYIPALQRLHRVVQDLDRFRREHPKLANPEMNTIVLFLSDGKPSDTIQIGRNQGRSRDPVAIARVIKEIMFAIYRTLGSDEKRLRFHTVGLGDADFVILRGMADALPQGVGSFHNARLSTDALLETLTAFSTTVSTTRQTSQVGGPRLLRPVTKAEQLGDEKWIRMNVYTAKGTWRVPEDWWAKIRKGQLSKKARNRLEDMGERVIAVSHVSFNQGGERNVFYLRMGDEQVEPNPTFTEVEFVPAGELVQVHGLRGAQRFSTDINGSIGVVEDMLMGARGEHKYRVNVSGTRMTVGIKNLRASSRVRWSCEEWVAKENLKIEATSEKETAFHQASLTTQATASALAEEFNGCIKALHLPQKLPEVQFVKKCFYMTVEVEGGGVDTRRHFFVEPFIDGTHRKWNTNTGKVNLTSVVESGGGGGGGGLGGIQEDDEEEEEEEAGSPSPFSKFQPVRAPTTDDVPQAFSHWSCTKPIQGKVKALLVCDLQGVFMPESFAFNWVDPVIHSDIGGHKGFFSRTDLGADGMKEFLRTHKCNALCRQLKLPHNFEYDPEYTKQSPSKAGDDEASRNTSQFTVVQTDHLKQRKEERDVTTRQLQAAKKHGVATSQAGGKVQYDHEGLRAVFGGPGASVGITTFRTRDGSCAQQPAASSSSGHPGGLPTGSSLRGQAGKLPSADLSSFSDEHTLQVLRFAVGTRVECYHRGCWEPGIIHKQFTHSSLSKTPYQIKLDNGKFVFDGDAAIRPSADDLIQRLAQPPGAAPEKTEVLSPAPPEAPSLRGGAKGKLEAEQKQRQQKRRDEGKKQSFLDLVRTQNPGWVTKASMEAVSGLPANWVAFSEQGVHGSVPPWSNGLIYYNFVEETWANTRPADEWQAVAPRRPQQSGKQPASTAAPSYVRMKMPRGARPRQILQFDYEHGPDRQSFRCTFEVPKGYNGQAEVTLIPPRNWPHGDSLVEHWAVYGTLEAARID